LLASTNADTENEVNFIFNGLLGGGGASRVSSVGNPNPYQTGDCDTALANALATLDSQTASDVFTAIVGSYIQAREDYFSAAEAAGDTPVIESPDTEADEDFPVLDADSVSSIPVETDCADLLRLANARLQSSANEVMQLVTATNAYQSQTAALSKRGFKPRSRAAAHSIDRSTCPTTTSQGFDWKVFALIAYRTDNCDGSYTIRSKGSALGVGFLDITCDIKTSSDTCKAGTRKGVSVGVASAYVYFGAIYSGNKFRGIYFKPEVCYDFYFWSDCSSTTLDWVMFPY